MTNPTDRELLELAAKAAGITIDPIDAVHEPENWFGWQPLMDDGDALRLAVTLGLVVDTSRPSAGEPFKLHHCGQEGFTDRNAATRRSIVRAAAAIGERQ